MFSSQTAKGPSTALRFIASISSASFESHIRDIPSRTGNGPERGLCYVSRKHPNSSDICRPIPLGRVDVEANHPQAGNARNSPSARGLVYDVVVVCGSTPYGMGDSHHYAHLCRVRQIASWTSCRLLTSVRRLNCLGMMKRPSICES